MPAIDAYSLATIPLDQIANGNVLGSATGFIWSRNEQAFLITNWHVVTGKNAETRQLTLPVRPERLHCLFNSKFASFGKTPVDILIRDKAGKPTWYVHPAQRVDVVAIPLQLTFEHPTILLCAVNSLRSDVDLAVRIGMDVFILGYPFPADPPGFPVWKRGSIASEPDLAGLGRGYLLVDTASRPGMSGAPVIRRSWGVHVLEQDSTSQQAAPQSKFIGVYSGRLHTNNPTDAQLGMVWPADLVREIVDHGTLDED